MKQKRWARKFSGMAVACVLAGCGGTMPESVKSYAGDLPARADGQYAPLPDPVKKQLVLKDGMLQCDIDMHAGMAEKDSAACQCAKSTSTNWTDDCKAWLGAHTPTAPAPAPVGSDTANPG